MIITDITTRDQIPEYLKATGRNIAGIELGVAAAKFTLVLLRIGWGRFYAVDRWSDHHDDAEARAATQAIHEADPSAIVLRRTFEEALAHIPDNHLSFIYIDGYAHTGQEGGKTLEDWWPKVRPGGIFAGHDYHQQWQPTIDAVDAFIGRHKLAPPHLTLADRYPSWIIQKP